MTDSWL